MLYLGRKNLLQLNQAEVQLCRKGSGVLADGELLKSCGTRDNGHKLKHEWFRLDIKKAFHTMKTAGRGNKLPRDAEQSLFLEIFKTRWNEATCPYCRADPV